MTLSVNLQVHPLGSARTPPMFRFTIRDVLWLMVVVGLSAGWWLEHHHTNQLREQLQRAWWWHGPGWRTGVSREVDWSVLGAEYNRQ